MKLSIGVSFTHRTLLNRWLVEPVNQFKYMFANRTLIVVKGHCYNLSKKINSLNNRLLTTDPI